MTYSCGPAHSDLVALAFGELIKHQPSRFAGRGGSRGKLSFYMRADGRATGRQGVDVEIVQIRASGGDIDGLGGDEDGLFRVGRCGGKPEANQEKSTVHPRESPDEDGDRGKPRASHRSVACKGARARKPAVQSPAGGG